MGKDHVIVIRLKNGTEYSYRKPYNYFDKGIIIRNIENARENDVVVFRMSGDEDLLIPKLNILFVKLVMVDSDE